MRGNHPYKLYGAVALAVVAGIVTLCLLAFNQVFTPTTPVTVQVSQAALQLLPGSDVKLRGIIVGSVDHITSDGHGAVLSLKLRPDAARTIPANVTVRMLPKTLFGEKYVDLVLPAHPSGKTLAAGAVIPEDRTTATLEIDQALNDLLPVLRAVPPAELDHTLTALATALQGRGEQLGQTITDLDAYLRGFDPHLPQLEHDLTALSGVTRTYTEAADPLLRVLRDLTVTGQTVLDQRHQISAFLADVTGAADRTRDLVARNAQDIVAVNSVNRGVLALFARYSPELPCFVDGYAKLIPRIHDAVPKTPGLDHAAHVVVEFVPSFPTYQYPIDLPEFRDTRGPSCYGLPNPPMSLPVLRYRDGTEDDPRFDAQAGSGSSSAVGTTATNSAATSPAMGEAGTAAERRALGSLLGPVLGTSAASVPAVADLLWGPMLRGSTVALTTGSGA